MEGITYRFKDQIWGTCHDRIEAILNEANGLRTQLGEKDKALRAIDPALLNDPRYSSEDWRFVQLIKTIYYVISAYVFSNQITSLSEEKTRLQEAIRVRGEVENRICQAFNRSFALESPISTLGTIKEEFATFGRHAEEISLEIKTNAFLDSDELRGTTLLMDDRCQLPVNPPSDSEESDSEEFYSFESSDDYLSCESDGEGDVPLVEETNPPLKIDNLFSSESLSILKKLFPLEHIDEIERLNENHYRLKFHRSLTGKVDKKTDGMQKELEAVIKERLKQGSGIITNLKKDYPSTVGTFLETCGINSLVDLSGIIWWDYLLGAWGAAEQCRCELDQELTVCIEGNKMRIVEGKFLAGVFITDYHLIKNNLFNRGLQTALYTCLKGLGLLNWDGSTQKPLRSTFFLSEFVFHEDGKLTLTIEHEEDRALSFIHKKWQEPQNFPSGDLANLRRSPHKTLHSREVDLIGMSFSWV